MSPKPNPVVTGDGPGENADAIFAAVYADTAFMRGVRRAVAEIEAGKKGTPFSQLKRKAHA